MLVNQADLILVQINDVARGCVFDANLFFQCPAILTVVHMLVQQINPLFIVVFIVNHALVIMLRYLLLFINFLSGQGAILPFIIIRLLWSNFFYFEYGLWHNSGCEKYFIFTLSINLDGVDSNWLSYGGKWFVFSRIITCWLFLMHLNMLIWMIIINPRHLFFLQPLSLN